MSQQLPESFYSNNKKAYSFIKFSISEFYPSISVELLQKFIHFAIVVIQIENEVINIIKHARKSLFHDNNA